jgi:hypothetical protein
MRCSSTIMKSLETITNLRIHSKRVEIGSWTLERWNDGTYFLESPTGEGTEVVQSVLERYLARIFHESF